MNRVEIYFYDLSEEKQKEVLALYEIEQPKEANLDVIPLFTLEQQ